VVTGARTPTSTSWSTAVRAIPCLRAADGDWSKIFYNIDYMVDCRPRVFPVRAAGGDWSKDFIFDHMVDCRPRNSLSEGCGW
jgi:hypothetical protein